MARRTRRRTRPTAPSVIPTADVLDAAARTRTSSPPSAGPRLGASSFPVYVPTAVVPGSCLQRRLAPVRHQGPRRQEARRLQARDRVHDPVDAARVLRRPGNDLGGPADPRGPLRDASRSTVATTTSTTTATACRLVAWHDDDDNSYWLSEHAARRRSTRTRCSRSPSRWTRRTRSDERRSATLAGRSRSASSASAGSAWSRPPASPRAATRSGRWTSTRTRSRASRPAS